MYVQNVNLSKFSVRYGFFGNCSKNVQDYAFKDYSTDAHFVLNVTYYQTEAATAKIRRPRAFVRYSARNTFAGILSRS